MDYETIEKADILELCKLVEDTFIGCSTLDLDEATEYYGGVRDEIVALLCKLRDDNNLP